MFYMLNLYLISHSFLSFSRQEFCFIHHVGTTPSGFSINACRKTNDEKEVNDRSREIDDLELVLGKRERNFLT